MSVARELFVHAARRCVLYLVALTYACDNPTQVRSGYTALLGEWSLQLTDTAGCSGSASTPRTIDFVVAQTAADSGQGLLQGILFLGGGTSTWQSGPYSGWTGGRLWQNASGQTDLFFVTGVYDPLTVDSSARVMHFRGTLTGQLALAGTLYDPSLSLVGERAPLLSPGPCAYRARGGHR